MPQFVVSDYPSAVGLLPSYCSASLPRKICDGTNHQRGPAGLVIRAETPTCFSVEIFVKEDEVAPMRITGETRIISMTWPAARASASCRRRGECWIRPGRNRRDAPRRPC